MAKKTRLLVVKVSPEFQDQLRRRAQADDRTVSGLVRRLIARELRDVRELSDARSRREAGALSGFR